MTDDDAAPLRHRNRWQFGGGAIDLRRPALAARPAPLRTEPAPVVLDLSRTALIVIDLQNDFCTPGGALDIAGIDVTLLAGAVEHSARAVTAARAAGVPVVWLTWGNRPDRANLPPGVAHVFDPEGTGHGIGFRIPGTDSRILTSGSWGADLAAPLTVEPGDIRVDKYRMSGFWDTPLDSVLRNLRVDTLLFAGINSDQCVYATLVDGACAGYDVVMLTDASATTSPSYCHDAAVFNTRQCFGFTTTTPDLLDALAAAPAADGDG
ncbi:cysteine hydrolase family protein [Streptomyces sp. NBC_01477]|uniref:cysteine hydrolase family protein n=1 Tax=Streptomyces sp. NBC_01477 TaxID=2976015 RepID=UPI002E353FCB|nr:cysteine hydrolase [Streptomyces sp. NBC_01477]